MHEGVGIALIATNSLAAIWGSVAWLRHVASIRFWYLLRAAQAVVVLQVALGLFLLIGEGKPAPDDLHVLYGVLPLVISLVAEGARAGVAQRELEGVEDPDALPREEQIMLARRVVRNEMGIMTIGCWAIVTLALRALSTGL